MSKQLWPLKSFGWLFSLCCSLVASQAAFAAPRVLVVVPDRSFVPALAAWEAHRVAQGYRIEYQVAPGDSDALQSLIAQWAKGLSEQRVFVLLAGDSPTMASRFSALPAASPSVPTGYVPARAIQRFGPEKQIATDLPFSDRDLNGIPDLAIGRIPAATPDQLASYLNRVIQYEQSEDYREWRDRLEVVAGIGGFGVLTDAAIELATRRLLGVGIPESRAIGLVHASVNSPHCPDPNRFQETVLQRLNRGPAFWIYIGHGHVQTLDNFRIANESLEILHRRSIDRVQIPNSQTIALFFACYTGAFDAREPCLAESLLLQPQGPIAVVASTRVTMPYGMANLGAELMSECYEQQCPTVGELLLQAKIRSIAPDDSNAQLASLRPMLEQFAQALSPEGHHLEDERVDHLALIHLLGDPTLRLSHPNPLRLECPTQIPNDSSLPVRLQLPSASKVTIELALRRDKLPGNLPQPKQDSNLEEFFQGLGMRYEAAQQTCLLRQQGELAAGDHQLQIELPALPRGKYLLRARAEHAGGWSLASQPLTISVADQTKEKGVQAERDSAEVRR
ncbi:MAG: C25 family cysteine peptidase [Pirellulaceae bacterium]|jgi:hypothetical protein